MISTNCRTIFPSVRTLLLSLLLLAALPGQSQDIPPRPQQLVNDYANLLTPGEQSRLEHKLVEYNDTTSIQIAIALEVSLQGQDDFQRALDIAQDWGVGQSETDNGLLIYVAERERKVRIVTGYGTEGFLPDALAKRLIDQVIVPRFRQQDYYGGLDRATDIIMKLGSGEYSADQLTRGREGMPTRAIVLLILLIIVVIFVISNSNKGDGGYYGGGRYNTGPRGGWMIFGPGSGGGGFGGGGGGFGGGGFGGFGGGGFGGGGAGGSW